MTWMRRPCRSEAGAALVELALALPVVVVVFVATIDFARVFYTSMALTDAARAGAQYGSLNAANSGDIPGMKAAAESATNTTGILATPTRLCQCATDIGTFGDTSPFNTCGATSCSGGQHLVVTVTVTTTKDFTTVITGFPSIPSLVHLSRTATMRVHQ
jgi:Flp pilus assembly protein TadG